MKLIETIQPIPAPSRREFCRSACQAASLMAMGTLAGCGGGGSPSAPSGPSPAPALPVLNGSVANSAVSVTVAAGSPLASVGGAAFVQSSAGQFLVAQTAADTFVALTATCTHEACTITGFRNQTYVCPCHGSQFSTGGSVLTGPASRSLPRFATSFANGTLTINL